MDNPEADSFIHDVMEAKTLRALVGSLGVVGALTKSTLGERDSGMFIVILIYVYVSLHTYSSSSNPLLPSSSTIQPSLR